MEEEIKNEDIEVKSELRERPVRPKEKSELYPSNSHKSKEVKPKARVIISPENKKKERITTGRVVKQKKSLGKRIMTTIMGDDSRSVAEYVVQDVLILAAKRMICDMVGWGGAAEMILFGEKSGRNTRRENNRYGSHTSYGSYYRSTERDYRDDRGGGRDRRDLSRVARSRHDFDDVIFDERGDAEEVLANLTDLIIDYGQATVRDFYDFAGIQADYTDEKYGWIDLRGVHISRLRNGFLINLPRTRLLD